MNLSWNHKLLILCLLLVFSSGCKKQNNSGGDDLTEINYVESLEIFPNPERGFIHNLITYSEGYALDPEYLAALRAENVTMVLRLYYLENFKDKPISDAELLLIRSDMQKLRDAGIKCVLRFAYTEEMTGTDAPFSIIEQHLDQLKPIFESDKDVIAFVQAGLIGAWGEWHDSSNGLATIANEKKVLEKLLSVLPPEIMVQVRTPGSKQQIFNTIAPITSAIAYTSENRARVGHHNDCFLAGGTDYGTYSNIQADKDYISKEAQYVPTGGETCPPEGALPGCLTSQTEMKLLKWTYLNLDWYQPVITAWKSSGCFNEFQRYLGYRLLLVNAKFPEQGVTGQDFKVEIYITNKGYAPLYNYKTANLIFMNSSSGEEYPLELTTDLRKCKPNGLLTISDTIQLTGIPAGEFDLYLKISDRSESLKDRMEYSVRLANTDLWDNDKGINDLLHKVTILAK